MYQHISKYRKIPYFVSIPKLLVYALLKRQDWKKYFDTSESVNFQVQKKGYRIIHLNNPEQSLSSTDS